MHEPQQADLIERPVSALAWRRDRKGLQAAGLESLNGLPRRNLGRVSPNGLYEPINADLLVDAPERRQTVFPGFVVPKSQPFISGYAAQEAGDQEDSFGFFLEPA